MKPHLVDDPDSWFSDRKVRGSVPTDFESNDDLEEFARQAYELGWTYHQRGREMVGSFFLSIGGAAEGEVEERHRTGDRSVCVDVAVPLDPTAPAEHTKDDLGTILAHVLALRDNEETSTEVNHLWHRVLIGLLNERDELRRRGRIQ
ncbi:MAG: hypothetical protein ACHQZR_00485 [Candidatus Limnocylindrales bacterium]